jgi:hypothetical protein
VERRSNPFRRSVADFREREGTWTSVGKSLDVYLLLTHADQIIPHWELLVVMLGFLIMPRAVERAIIAFRGGGSSYSRFERSERMEASPKGVEDLFKK